MGTLLSAVSPRQVTLHAGAEFDAHRVNQYTLTLSAACPGEEEVEERLFVQVMAGQVLRCDAPFASAGRSRGTAGAGWWGLRVPAGTVVPRLCRAIGGDVVRVSADVAPRTPLYVVLPQPLGGLTVSGGCPGVPQPPLAGTALGMVGPRARRRGQMFPPSSCCLSLSAVQAPKPGHATHAHPPGPGAGACRRFRPQQGHPGGQQRSQAVTVTSQPARA